MERITILLDKVVLFLDIIKFLVTLEEHLVFALDLLDVASENTVLTVVIIDQIMQLFKFLLQFIATHFVIVHLAITSAGFSGSITRNDRLIVSVPVIVVSGIGCGTKTLTQRGQELVSLLGEC